MSLSKNTTTATVSANKYKELTGGSTVLVVREMIQQIQKKKSITPSSHFLDNATGPGIAIGELLDLLPGETPKITAVDLAPSMLDEVRQLMSEQKRSIDIDYLLQDVRTLDKVPASSVSHVVTSFGIVIPGEEDTGARQACKAVYRVLQGGGVAAFSIWADRSFPTAFQNAAKIARPDQEPPKGPWVLPSLAKKGSWLFDIMESAGFGRNVSVMPFTTYASAPSLDVMIERMMMTKKMFWAGLTDDEMRAAEKVFKNEFSQLKAFEVLEDGSVRIAMMCWIGVGWKSDAQIESTEGA